jgi:hypothetical protein
LRRGVEAESGGQKISSPSDLELREDRKRTWKNAGARIGWVQAFRKHWRVGAANARGAIMVGELNVGQRKECRITPYRTIERVSSFKPGMRR